MSLAEYRGKRRFARTPEPRGRNRKSPGRIFVIQQHAARRLHFDLRLELGGTLKSWAVPKGLSLDPKEKRLAVHVEDHPLEYADFEGTIPDGEYGAGAVIVWDRGEWEPLGDADRDYGKGELKFRLHGQKLNGAWVLVRMRRKQGEDADNWLVIKERDESAVPHAKFDIVTERPGSVLSRRTLAEVASAGARSANRRKGKQRRGSLNLLQMVKATANTRPGPLPAAVEPALARTAPRAPVGDQWLHEIKFDGYRVLAWLDHGKVQLRTRHGHDWSARFPEIALAVSRLPANSALLDGEIVSLLPTGASSFSSLQQALSGRRTSQLVYYIFDVLNLEGYDLQFAELEQRKSLLNALLSRNDNDRLQFVNHVVGDGPEFFAHCRTLGLEGIISKRRKGPYRSGRTDEWLKVKCVQSEPFVIGGFTSPKGRTQLSALMLGYHDDQGRLIYAGRVGTGFSEATSRSLEAQLQTLRRPTSPFTTVPPKEAGRDVHWVRPQLVAQVRFAGWSADGIVRHAVFEGLRDDNAPSDIVRELVTAGVKNHENDDRPPERAAKRPRDSGTALQPVRADLKGVPLTNPGKVLFPDAGITKLDLVKYYVEIADWILPQIINRPLTLVRCPNGIEGETFYQKHAGPETPAPVGRVLLSKHDEKQPFLFIRDLKGLLSLVQISVLEIHPWGSQIDKPDRPDRMIFDLDPDAAVPWPTVIQAALRIRDRLHNAGLLSFVKTTGGKGLHIMVPLERRQSWEVVKRFSQQLAQSLSADYPQSYTVNQSKRARPGKVYLDYRRNSEGSTAVAAYSTRARAGAPVSTPIAWEELSSDLHPDQFKLGNLAQRLTSLITDPWRDITRVRQAVTGAMLKQL